MADELDDLGLCRNTSADGPQAFGKRSHINIYFVFHIVVAGDTLAVFTHDTQAMGFINHDVGSIVFREFHNGGKVGNITAHTEYAVGNNNLTFNIRIFFQIIFQMVHIIVMIADSLSLCHATHFIDTGMVFPIRKSYIPPPQETGYGALVCLEPRGHDNGIFPVQERGKLPFQGFMQIESTIEKTTAGATTAKLFQRIPTR